MSKEQSGKESVKDLLKALVGVMDDVEWTGLELVRVIQFKTAVGEQWTKASEQAKEEVADAERHLNLLIKDRRSAEEINDAQRALATVRGVQIGVGKSFAMIGLIIASGMIQDGEASIQASDDKEMMGGMQKHFKEAASKMGDRVEYFKQKNKAGGR